MTSSGRSLLGSSVKANENPMQPRPTVGTSVVPSGRCCMVVIPSMVCGHKPGTCWFTYLTNRLNNDNIEFPSTRESLWIRGDQDVHTPPAAARHPGDRLTRC